MSFANQPGISGLTYTTLPRSVIVNRESLTPFWNSSGSPEVNSKRQIGEQENVWTTGHYETQDGGAAAEFNCRGRRHGLEKEGRLSCSIST